VYKLTLCGAYLASKLAVHALYFAARNHTLLVFWQPTLAVLSRLTDSRDISLIEQLGKLAVEGVRFGPCKKQ